MECLEPNVALAPPEALEDENFVALASHYDASLNENDLLASGDHCSEASGGDFSDSSNINGNVHNIVDSPHIHNQTHGVTNPPTMLPHSLGAEVVFHIPLVHHPAGPHEVDKNCPDPFDLHMEIWPHVPYSMSHIWPPIHLLYLMAIWLHSYHHVSFHVIGTILSIVQIILCVTGFDLDPLMVSAVTLMTVNSHLSVEPVFQILPICPVCQEVYPSLLTTPKFCLKCVRNDETVMLFENMTHSSTNERSSQQQEPIMHFPFKSVSEQLQDLLAEPGVEDLLDQW